MSRKAQKWASSAEVFRSFACTLSAERRKVLPRIRGNPSGFRERFGSGPDTHQPILLAHPSMCMAMSSFMLSRSVNRYLDNIGELVFHRRKKKRPPNKQRP
jgi:hypothetical protein